MSPLARCQAVTTVDFPEHKIRCQLPADHKGDHEHHDGEPAPVTWPQASAEPRPALTTGELHARAKALGLKGAGATGPIARAAYEAHRDTATLPGEYLVPWDQVGPNERRGWRSAVLAALEALPEPEPALLAAFPGQSGVFPGGGLRPGDVVSVRGVVKYVGTAAADVAFDDDGGLRTVPLMLADLTFIERPAPPEPDWQPGDLAEDDMKRRFSNIGPVAWFVLGEDSSVDLSDRIFSRDQIPGPLHKLTVTREDAP